MVATDAQVEAAFSQIAQRVKPSPEMFSKAIAQRGVSAQTLKDRIRAEIGWATLIRRKYQSRYASRDVTAALAARGPTSNKATQFTLRQVVFVLPKGASDAQANQRRTEAIGAKGRFPGCDQAVDFASKLRDVAVKEPVTRSSGQLRKEMNEILLKAKIGGLTDPQRGEQGWEMIAVCDRKEVADDSAVKQQLMEEMVGKEAEEQSKKYLAQLRSRAVIENR
jgi:peptidyl-prolyl cis-trans isomerase SurA